MLLRGLLNVACNVTNIILNLLIKFINLLAVRGWVYHSANSASVTSTSESKRFEDVSISNDPIVAV